MLSIDSNILLHAFNEDSVKHATAAQWLESIAQDEAVAISELILAEFYGLLRNPAVLKHPLPADEAAEVIQAYRTHPRWRLIGFPIESRRASSISPTARGRFAAPSSFAAT
jgi:predicted nucleic acid-binding protein